MIVFPLVIDVIMIVVLLLVCVILRDASRQQLDDRDHEDEVNE